MKIVFLSPASQTGGAEAVLLDLLAIMREARPDWHLHVVAGEDGPLLEKIRALGVPAEGLNFPRAIQAFGENRQRAGASAVRSGRMAALVGRGARLVRWLGAGAGVAHYTWRLRRRLAELRPDVLHSNGMKMHLLGALAQTRSTPLIWHLHDYLGNRPAMKPLLRRLASRCALAVANSESVAADVRAVLPGGPPVHAVYNAVDPQVFTPVGTASDLDQLAGLPPAAKGTVRIGLVATFAFWKGHEVFLRAAAGVTTRPVRFYVIGGPVYATAGSQRTLAELRALADEVGLADRVGFTGFVADVPAAMRALDVVVHASTEPEPFGLVIVQAMACERAVIVSAAGGARELVEPESDALVHSPGSVNELTAAMERLSLDADLRARLGRAARVHAAQRFSRTRMAERIVPLYETLLP